MGNLDIGGFILFMVALLFSLSVHETGHALVSYWFGDDLAKSRGRISMNPAAHIDPIGTLLFPIVSFFTGAALLGWAKPVPVNPLAWRNKRVANFWVSIAGIIGNLMIALFAAILIRILLASGVISYLGGQLFLNSDLTVIVPIWKFIFTLFTLNIGLAIFNLLPIPPLDGGGILQSILPDSFGDFLENLNQFGFILLFVLVMTGATGKIFAKIMPVFYKLLFIGA
jgi:Zn-dependent protease